MDGWKTLSRTQLASFGKYLTVESHALQLPDGQIIDRWPWLIAPDYINVLAITPQGQALIFCQGKYALEGESLAPIGGFIEPGEDPLLAAQRELLEETGYAAPEWEELGHFCVDPNRGMGTGYLYLARGATFCQPPHADDLEEQTLLLMPISELRIALRDGKFLVLAWAANIALALLALD